LIIGDGKIGKLFYKYLKEKRLKVKLLKKSFVNLNYLKKVSHKYQYFFLTFGITSIKKCNINKKKAHYVNYILTKQIIYHILNLKKKVVFLSSDIIFLRNQIGRKNILQKIYYAKLKIDIESLFKNNKNFISIRFSKIFFNYNDIYKLKKNYNKYCCPILAIDVCRILYKIIFKFRGGLYNYSSKPALSFNDIKNIFENRLTKIKENNFPILKNSVFKLFKKKNETTNSLKVIKCLKDM